MIIWDICKAKHDYYIHRVCLYDNNALQKRKTKSFAFLKRLMYRQQVCQNIPRPHGSTKMNINAVLYTPGQQLAMSLYKESPHACLQTVHVICTCMTSPFSQISIFIHLIQPRPFSALHSLCFVFRFVVPQHEDKRVFEGTTHF